MDSFKQNPQKVFPFTVGWCDTIKTGETCRLDVDGIDWLDAPYTAGAVRVSETLTSFTFTVQSSQYFVGENSTITFATYERGGDLYLEQHGEATSTTITGWYGYYSGEATKKWKTQAENLAGLLQPDVTPTVQKFPIITTPLYTHGIPVGVQ